MGAAPGAADDSRSRVASAIPDQTAPVIAAHLDADPSRGLAALTPYDGRHSFASALIHEGRSVIEVAAQLGHTSAQTTLKHYAHIVEEARGGDRMNLGEAVELARSGTQGVRNLYAPRARGHLRLVD